MATYKLIQDIEAEDHILGPLTLRQFIYSLVTAFLFYICFLVITKHVPILLLLFLPPALFGAFLAFPFKRDQPTEVWALAKFRYFLKPKRRIWSQSGIKNLVTITAPKKIERQLTNGLSQNDVSNRLKSLATMIDSRGWAIKNVGDAPDDVALEQDANDRLITVGSIPKPVLEKDIDIFSEQSPQAQHMSEMIEHRTQEMHQRLQNIMSQPEQVSRPASDPINESALSSGLKSRRVESNLSTSSLHTIQTSTHKPLKRQSVMDAPKTNQPQPSHINPSVLSFALNNTGLSVQTLAKEANKTNPDNEVVINLH